MNARTRALGGALGVAAFVVVGLLATSGQLVSSGQDTLASLLFSCTEGQQPRKVSGVWACADGGTVAGGDITSVSTAATSGLTGGCTSGDCAITMLATCNVGEALRWSSDTGWTCRQTVNDYRSKHLEWVDEWLGFNCASNAACGSVYTANLAGAAGAIIDTNGGTRPGIADFRTGTTATGRASVSTSSTSFDLNSHASSVYETTGGVPTLSTVAEEYATWFGFFDTVSTVNQVDGCWVMYDRLPVATAPGTGTIVAGSDTLQCWCSSNSVRTGYTMNGVVVSSGGFTTVNAPVAALTLPDTNILNVKIVVTGSALAEFYVNGTKSCQITTNIPTGMTRATGAGLAILKSAGTTNRSMYVDRSRLAIDMTAARSP